LAQTMPDAGSPYFHGTRRVFPRAFPHSIVYRDVGDKLVVIAVAPFRRKPDYWGGRS
jgi:toxin ParE1/3/4